MKLHLPKAILTAVLAAGFAAPAGALTIDAVYDFSAASFISIGDTDATDNGVQYIADTGEITGIDSSNIFFALDQSSLSTGNSTVIYITTNGIAGNGSTVEKKQWGINTNTEQGLTGYWPYGDGTNGTWGNNGSVSKETLDKLAENGRINLKASITTSGTYLYDSPYHKVYDGSGLLTTSAGSVETITVNKQHVSRVYTGGIEVSDYTVKNADGSWQREYDSCVINAFPTSSVAATIITDGHTLWISGNNETTNYTNSASDLVENGGDIIVGNNGQLYLQTWQTDAIRNGLDIDLSGSDTKPGAHIYLGSSNKGAMKLAAWSGNITLGAVTLIEDSVIVKERAANGNTVNFAGKLSGEYVLTLKGQDDGHKFDGTIFSGEVDLKELKTEGNSGVDVAFSNKVTLGTLSSNSTTTLSFGGETKIATINASGATKIIIGEAATSTNIGDIIINPTKSLEFDGSGTVNVSGVINTRWTNTSAGANLIVNEDVTVSAVGLKNDNGITATIDGILTITGTDGLQLLSGSADSIRGTGTIKTTKLLLGNTGTYVFSDGVRVEIGSGGITTASNGKGIFKDVTLAATESWTIENNGEKDFFSLGDSTNGTKLEVAAGKTVTIREVVTDWVETPGGGEPITHEGKLVKTGAGTLKLEATNTYSGGTSVEAGMLEVNANEGLGTGKVEVANGATLQIGYGVGITTVSSIDLAGGATLDLRNGAGTNTTVDTAITTSDGAIIRAGFNGHNTIIDGSISGSGNLTLAQNVWSGYTDNKWNILAELKDKSATEKLSIIYTEGTQAKFSNNNNTYSGGTTITGGTLTTASENALGTGTVKMQGGTLEMAAALRVTAMEYTNGTVNNGSHSLNVGTLTVAEGATMSLSGSGATTAAVVDLKSGASLSAAGALTMGSLTMGDGSKLAASDTITLSGADNRVLDLGSKLTLDGEWFENLLAELTGSNTATLFEGVTELKLNGVAYANQVDLADHFLNVEQGKYYLAYADSVVYAGLGEVIPEPTTATLSLLALAGLCARRRRRA